MSQKNERRIPDEPDVVNDIFEGIRASSYIGLGVALALIAVALCLLALFQE